MRATSEAAIIIRTIETQVIAETGDNSLAAGDVQRFFRRIFQTFTINRRRRCVRSHVDRERAAVAVA